MFKSFLIGLQFLTRIFIVKQSVWTEKNFGESVKFFPAIGAIIGIISATIVSMINYLNLSLFAGAMGFASLVIITGGIHCDGLMDSVDGLFSGRDREKILEIMKDSNAGSFAVLSMILVATIEISSLVELANFSTIWASTAIYVAPIVGRLMMVLTIGSFPYAREKGMGLAFAKFTTRRTIIFAALETFLLILPLIIIHEKIFFSALMTIIITGICAWKFADFATKKIGGVTGDIYGAVTILTEMITLIIFLMTASLDEKFL